MKKRFDETERTGVNRVEKIFLDFGWIPRRILESDVGIDMEIEIAENGQPNGKLIAVQIKAGKSYFKLTKEGNFVFYPNPVHLEYWLKHSLPVILIIVDLESNVTLWQEVSSETLSGEKKEFKIIIPSDQYLDETYKSTISELNKLPPLLQKVQNLAVQYDLMTRIDHGEKIVVEFEEWINKSVGKAGIAVKSVDFFNKETTLMESNYIFFSGVDDLYKLFPWAEFNTDEDYYSDHDEQNWIDNYAIYDREDDCYRSATMTLEEYKNSLSDIRPIEMGSGEVHFYRLEMSLNKLGKAFILLNHGLVGGIS